MEKNVAGTEARSGLGLGIERELVLRALELAGVLLAFNITYAGVRLLEGQRHITRGVVYFVVATIVLVVVTWRVRQRDEAASLTLPALSRSTLRRPGLLARELAASWQAVAWWGLLLAAIGLGFAFRLYEIASAPFGIWFDEAQNGIVAQQILHGDRPMFIGGLTQLPGLFFYVFALAIKLLGDNVTSLRAVTTAAGILTVLFIYLLARELFDQRVAVLSTFFLAVMRWHVNFSRFAMHGIFAPLFMVTTFYFLVRGLKGKGLGNFVVAGVMAGIGLQGYYSFLLVPFLIGFYVLHHTIFERVLPWRKLLLGLGAFAIVTAIVYAPLGIWALQHPDEFNQRAQTLTITKDRSASEVMHVAYKSMKQHLLMFSSAGDRNGRHNIPGAPMLDIYTGSLLVLGAGYALSRANKSSYFLLLAWVVITLQGGIWSVDFEAPQAFRTVGITPALAMLAALPLALLWRVAAAPAGGGEASPGKSRLPPASRVGYYALGGVAALVTIFALVQAGRINFDKYFNVQLKRFDAWAEYSTDATIASNEMRRLGPDYAYRLSATLQGQPTIRFQNPVLDGDKVRGFDWVLDIPSSTDTPIAYLLDETKQPLWEWLHQLYPQADFRQYGPPLGDGPNIIHEAVVPLDAVLALRGIDATYTPTGGPPVSRREQALDLDWSVSPPVSLPADATWSGVLEAPEYKDYTTTLEVPGSAQVFLDGEKVAEGSDRISFARKLYKGEHDLRIEAHIERPGVIRLLWGDDSPVPATAFFSYPLAGHGLIGSFYPNESWQGNPVLVQLDPLVGFQYHSELDSVGRPFTVAWTGFLDVPYTDDYAFQLEAHEEGTLIIDNVEVDAKPGTTNPIHLSQGRHAIEVRLFNTGGFANVFLYWLPPFVKERQIIPPDRLWPR